MAHAAALRSQFEALHEYVEDVAERLDQRMATAEQRLDGAIAYRALVRYDAYGEMSGRQSTSIALLDANRSGVVLSSIHHRDQARLYAKQVHDGRGELELSPEEDEAIQLALEGGADAAPLGRRRLHRRAADGAMRAGYFGPEGTYTQEALLGRHGGRGARARAAADDLRHRDGGPRRHRRAARWCRSRTRWRARSTPRSTRWRWRPTT